MKEKSLKKSEKEKNIIKFQQRLNKPGNLFEYFAIIGINPKISSKNFLYELSNDLTLKPEIITKYPPINKPYINFDENICELFFPEKIKIEKYIEKPKPEIYKYLLGNSFYSYEYPLKYLTCLKFYESLEQYQILNKKILQENKNNSFDFDLNNINNYFQEKSKNRKRNKSQKIFHKKNIFKNDNDLSKYYIPKVICFISLKPCYFLHEKILYQLYNYIFLEKIKIPIEKIVLNILCNIPIPPRGIHIYQYQMANGFTKINIQSEQMNKIKNFDEELKIIFDFFDIDNFIEIFKNILFETKTIIFSSNVNNLCNIIHGLISILYPFSYPFQISSCLKEEAFEILESISPYILGINQKYEKDFFAKNKIEIKGANYLIVDLDNRESFIHSIENSPNIPKNILKKFKTKIEIGLNSNYKNNLLEEKNEENTITFAFYDFFLNVLNNYNDFLNKENLKKNFKIKNLQILFKTKEFIESHSYSERPFYKMLTQTQMFNDFIFKKMIPKDITDKLDILLFDENINKKNNKKFFSKNKSVSFLLSKEYEYKSIHKIPKVKTLNEEELNFYKKNKYYYKKNLIKGQEVILEKNGYFFNYILFPSFNNIYYEFPSNELFLYFYTMENITNDINRVNTDLLAKSLIDKNETFSLSNEGEGMLDYIYLTYIEVWGYSFWYQDLSERDFRFRQLLEILDKIKRQEIELFNVLFEMLDKFHEKEKIRKLYYKILEYKLTPNSFIYSIVGKNIKNEKNEINFINNTFYFGKKEEKIYFQRRTFKSENEINILGDNIHFVYLQECPECGRKIDIKIISKDYKKMKKDLLWAQCPLCLNYIKPQISVILGNDTFPGKKINNLSLSKKEFFTLYSPYELKNHIKYIIDKDQFHLLNIDKLRNIFPNIFWNCIWYFHLYDLDYSIILPYEVNIYKKKASSNIIITPFIITKICPSFPGSNSISIEENNLNNNQIIINNNNLDNNTINKYDKNKLIIHNNISLEYKKENNHKKISLIEILDSLELKKRESDINLNLYNRSSMGQFNTPTKKVEINTEESYNININMSKSTAK